jgi:hypothetical protein
MSNGQSWNPAWIKIIATIVGAVFAVGVAWALVKGDIRANCTAIERNSDSIEALEESDKEIIRQMNDTEVILRGIQTDIEWIRSTMERGNEGR